MPNRKRSRDGRHWEIDGVSEQARRAAEDAALQAGAPLEIWLAETVLRASQEGGDAATAATPVTDGTASRNQ
ncbi:MAG: hypothetical protein AB7O63_10305 [Reyranellaceae bacterium]